MLMNTQVFIEVALNLSMLTAASIYDLKEREVPDQIWLAGILSGIALRAYYFENTILYLFRAYILLLLMGTLIFIEWKLSISGEADILAYSSLIVTDMSFSFNLPSPLAVYLLSKVIMILLIPIQFMVNVIRVKRNPKLLEGFEEPLWRKILALFLLSPYSRHLSKGATVAEKQEDGGRKFILGASLSALEPNDVEEEGKWIAPTYPMIPMILLGYLISLLC